MRCLPFVLFSALAGVACTAPAEGLYDGWFEDRAAGLVPEQGPAAFSLDLAGDAIEIDLLDAAQGQCSWTEGNTQTIHWFDQPQSFSVGAWLEDGGFSTQGSLSVSGERRATFEGEWVSRDRVEGDLVVEMEQDCRGNWVACLQGSECSRDAPDCSEDDREEVDVCEWSADSSNCFEEALEAARVCFPSAGAEGNLSGGGDSCSFSDGTSITFEESLEGDRQVVEVLDPNGAWCMGFDWEQSEPFVSQNTLRTRFGDYSWQTHRGMSDVLDDGQLVTWSCPGGCGWEAEIPLTIEDDTCEDAQLPGGWFDQDDDSVELGLGSQPSMFDDVETSFFPLFECS